MAKDHSFRLPRYSRAALLKGEILRHRPLEQITRLLSIEINRVRVYVMRVMGFSPDLHIFIPRDFVRHRDTEVIPDTNNFDFDIRVKWKMRPKP